MEKGGKKETKTHEEEKPKGKPEGAEGRPQEKKRLLNVIRLGETNLDGNKILSHAILDVRGVSFSFANAISEISRLGKKKVCDLSEDEIKKVEDIINHPEKHSIPSWMYNRRKDMETGVDKHLSVSQLEFTNKLDIGRVKKIKSYKGIRHISGLPVRGQRTRSSFRKGKVVGVSKKKGPQSSKQGKK